MHDGLLMTKRCSLTMYLLSDYITCAFVTEREEEGCPVDAFMPREEIKQLLQ